MSYYALTDSDWPWDDAGEGRAIVVKADTPEEAVKVATEKMRAEDPHDGGICWKVARLNLVGFEGATWELGKEPVYDGFTYYADGINGRPDAPPFRRLLEAAIDVIASASDTFKKRNGHLGSFQDDSGEKCWIVPFDAFEGLRSALSDTQPASTALVEKLTKALEPFAKEADKFDPVENDDHFLTWGTTFTIGDLRRARAALSASTSREGER